MSVYKLAPAKHCPGFISVWPEGIHVEMVLILNSSTQWLEINSLNQPGIHKMLTGSGKFLPMSVLPFWEVETWAWNSANSEVTSLSLFLLVLPHPAAVTGLEFSEAHMILVLLRENIEITPRGCCFQRHSRSYQSIEEHRTNSGNFLLSFLKRLFTGIKAFINSSVLSLHFTKRFYLRLVFTTILWDGQGRCY